MTKEKSAEIKRLAGIVHDKQQYFKGLGMTNIPTDLTKARELYCLYAAAQAECEEAYAALRRAKGK